MFLPVDFTGSFDPFCSMKCVNVFLESLNAHISVSIGFWSGTNLKGRGDLEVLQAQEKAQESLKLALCLYFRTFCQDDNTGEK